MENMTSPILGHKVEVTGSKRVYTVPEIQDILGISRPTAYTLVKKNCFRSVRIGGQIRISKKSFDEWLDRETGGAANG